ncbi:hypothetical protein OS493_009016 [Desmophyllum pertusum]|uniref:HECT domain-containing protein n=1 Tax=Desmophyllum pertusum TaxID=174260 RepID=A0A9X0D0Q7_9CNID|nr:hypothetical protein OS493_009016 [Desmophyllum pertusum]
MFQDVPENMLVNDFLSRIPEMERSSFQSVLQGRGKVDGAILSCLSLYNVRKVPSGQQLETTILDIARCEFLVKPQAIMRAFKSGMFDCKPEPWSTVRQDELVNLYDILNVEPDKVSEMVVPSEFDQSLNQAKDRVFNFLIRFLKSCTKEMAIAFLRYCTGSNVMVVPRIEVSFVDVSGLARRPVAHTCTARLDLSTSYESYASFCREFSKILTNEDAFRFNAM